MLCNFNTDFHHQQPKICQRYGIANYDDFVTAITVTECDACIGLWPTQAIACFPLDAGQMIDRYDRPTADFRDTELSSN